jgi:hypothetical protein
VKAKGEARLLHQLAQQQVLPMVDMVDIRTITLTTHLMIHASILDHQPMENTTAHIFTKEVEVD